MASALPWPDLTLFSGNPQESRPQTKSSPTSATWGPSHSFDSETDDNGQGFIANACVGKMPLSKQQSSSSPAVSSKKEYSAGSGNTNPNQGSAEVSQESAPAPAEASQLERIWEKATGFVSPSFRRNIDILQDYVGESCIAAPCYSSHDSVNVKSNQPGADEDIPVLGIARMAPPTSLSGSPSPVQSDNPNSSSSQSSPVHRRIQRHQEKQMKQTTVLSKKTAKKSSSPAPQDEKLKAPPLSTLEVQGYQVCNMDRTISELTMRSSYGGYEASLAKLPDNRRMAYYAVGKHHRQSSRGGNRRCYFTGKLILGGAPFYAGTVLQGLRTLVVFCLPSAVGLPDKDMLNSKAMSKVGSSGGVITSVSPRAGASKASSISHFGMDGRSHLDSHRGSFLSRTKRNQTNGSSSIASRTIGSKSMSKFSLDDLSLSIDGDLDPNWGLDRDFLLKVLPEANKDVLDKMRTLYPEQFGTLPVQVRDSKRWKLFIKFCFFSGLPIAEGEMHYRVQTDLAESTYGEEIVLSHDVMEAVNGASAEILTLPNTKAFYYLRKHYNTQCGKLDERVFRRDSWERVAPEV